MGDFLGRIKMKKILLACAFCAFVSGAQAAQDGAFFCTNGGRLRLQDKPCGLSAEEERRLAEGIRQAELLRRELYREEIRQAELLRQEEMRQAEERNRLENIKRWQDLDKWVNQRLWSRAMEEQIWRDAVEREAAAERARAAQEAQRAAEQARAAELARRMQEEQWYQEDLLRQAAERAQAAQRNAPSVVNCKGGSCWDNRGGFYHGSSKGKNFVGPGGRFCHIAGNQMICN
jgi:hypothetical protein